MVSEAYFQWRNTTSVNCIARISDPHCVLVLPPMAKGQPSCPGVPKNKTHGSDSGFIYRLVQRLYKLTAVTQPLHILAHDKSLIGSYGLFALSSVLEEGSEPSLGGCCLLPGAISLVMPAGIGQSLLR